MRPPSTSRRALVLAGAAVLASAATPGANAQVPCVALLAGRCPTWEARYDGPASEADAAEVLAGSPDGERLFVGGTRTMGATLTSHDTDMGVVAYDARTGAQRWVAGYGGAGYGEDHSDWVADLVVSEDGARVYATGVSAGAGTFYDYAVVALDARTGSRLWVSRYAGFSDDWDQLEAATGATVTIGGTERSLIVVTGWSTPWTNGEGRGGSGTTIAYDAETGQEVWRTVEAESGPQWRDVTFAEGPGGASTILVTGSSYGIDGTVDYTTVAYDARTGARRWTSRYAGEGSGDTFISGSYPWSIAPSPDGTAAVITGWSTKADLNEGFSTDIVTIAYEVDTGKRRWLARFDSGGEDSAQVLAMDPSGARVYVTGSVPSETAGSELLVHAYDLATGEPAWVVRRGIPSLGTSYAITTSPDGTKVFVVGAEPRAALALAFDAATGTEVWSGVTGLPLEQVYGVVVSPDGSLVHAAGAGQSAGREGDFLTLTYDA